MSHFPFPLAYLCQLMSPSVNLGTQLCVSSFSGSICGGVYGVINFSLTYAL